MLETNFNDMFSIMKKYVSEKETYSKKLESIDKMYEYSEKRKGELKAEQKEMFTASSNKLESEFSNRVEQIKKEIRDRQTGFDLGSSTLANAIAYFNALSDESYPEPETIKLIADHFISDNNSLGMLISIAKNKRLNKSCIDILQKNIYSESRIDNLLDGFVKVVNGTKMIQYLVNDVVGAAHLCNVELTAPEINDDIGSTIIARKAMGLPV